MLALIFQGGRVKMLLIPLGSKVGGRWQDWAICTVWAILHWIRAYDFLKSKQNINSLYQNYKGSGDPD
jgi:hypothetical protein